MHVGHPGYYERPRDHNTRSFVSYPLQTVCGFLTIGEKDYKQKNVFLNKKPEKKIKMFCGVHGDENLNKQARLKCTPALIFYPKTFSSKFWYKYYY